MKIAIVIIFGIIVLACISCGCFYAYLTYQKKAGPKLVDGGIRVACIGDSITFGTGVVFSRNKNSYPAQLQALMGDEYQVLNYGRSRATLLDSGDMPYMEIGFWERAIEAKSEIFIIMLGSNDSKPYNWDGEKYKKQYISMIRKLQALENNPQIYVVVPVEPFIVKGNDVVLFDIDGSVIRDEVQPIVQQVAKETDVTVINLYELFRGHPEYAPDGVHPNKEGNRLITEAIYQAIAR